MIYLRATSDLRIRVNRAWRWLCGGLHVWALPLLLFSLGHQKTDLATDPDFWTT